MSTYKGRKNDETWLVKLWLDNEPYTYFKMQELAKLHEGEAYAFSQAIEEAVQEQLAVSIASSRLGKRFGDVCPIRSRLDGEIAQSCLEEVEQDAV
jgi:hypothetical protein